MVERDPSSEPNREEKQTVVVAIDGPAAAGKSTVARLLAKRLGFMLLDSGALYRALALHLLRQQVPEDAREIPRNALTSLNLRIQPEVASMRVLLDGEDVTALIREEHLGSVASRFSALPEVREALLGLQRSAGRRWNLVAEGRDMGTVVFPRAGFKFFLVADPAERSRRRYLELQERGEDADPEKVRSEMEERDQRDQSRAVAPLIKAPDAIAVDTTPLGPDEVVELMIDIVTSRRNGSAPLP